MNQLQFYNASVMAKRDLDYLCDTYKVPHQVLVYLNRDPRGDIDSQVRAVYKEWEHSMESVYGTGFASDIENHITDLLRTVTLARRELQETNTSSFEKRCCELLRQVRVAGSDAFVMNEGKQFDFTIRVGFKERDDSGEAIEWSYTTHENGGYWHGNNRITVHAVTMNLTPAYLKKVHEHFRFFMNGKNKCWVLGAEELNNHALNDCGYRVFRATCFGLVPDERQPVHYPMYIIDSPEYKGEDGQVLFAHGVTVNAAHNLLKRRIKSETLKRLSF